MRRKQPGLKKMRAYNYAKMSDENVTESSARLEKCGPIDKPKAVKKVYKATHLDWKKRELSTEHSCLLKLIKGSH